MIGFLGKILFKLMPFYFFKKNNDTKISKKSVFKKCKYLKCSGNFIDIGNSKFVNCSFYIHGSKNTFIVGDNCIFNNVVFYLSDASSLVIGTDTRVFGPSHLASCEGKKVTIGADCLISSNVTIRNTDSHSVVDLNGKRLNYAKDVKIGKHVWICNGVSILKGSSIGNNSIVGNGSIVNKAIDADYVLLCGAPAQIKKRDINWQDKKLV